MHVHMDRNNPKGVENLFFFLFTYEIVYEYD